MPAVPRWSAPIQFILTNPYSSARGETLTFNDTDAVGQYLVQQTGCQFTMGIRETTDNVPQANGSILHHRFLTGAKMQMAVSLFVDEENPACDEILVELLDNISGALRSLLNAGDNAGRLAWEIDGGNERMLDDVRLADPYPAYGFDGAFPTVTFTIDSQYPYAQDLNQQSTAIADGATETLDNTGTADYDPVFQVQGPFSNFTLENLTTGLQFVYDDSLPGAVSVGGGDFAEIDTFRNTIFLNGNGANLKAGVDELNSDYWSLVVGENDVTIDGTSTTVLWAPAWG